MGYIIPDTIPGFYDATTDFEIYEDGQIGTYQLYIYKLPEAPVTPVPEPGAFALLLTVIIAQALLCRFLST